MTANDDSITLGEVARAVARIESRQQLDEGKYVLVRDFEKLVVEVQGIRKLFGRVVWLLAATLMTIFTAAITLHIH
jgi:hypothetical protein